ncbi:tol-pal system protein YbgF [Limnohabitans sp.]|jgi:tol-pal system protein YbgF|uniref:tol-pal system protein YbgF n=1 Tax=Limnohabitans sp. TaxID=1907725 RepID=UPI0037BF8539
MMKLRSPWRLFGISALLVLSGWAGSAHAALFGDDEARRAILDLRQRLEQSNAANQALIEQSARAQSQSMANLRSALLDLQMQIDTLKTQLAQSLGAQERLAKDLTELQLTQKDLLKTFDDRLRRFEPVTVSLDGQDVLVDPAAKVQYDNAMVLFRQADFVAAQKALDGFVQRHVGSAYVPTALFWLGNAQYANKAYRDAADNFQKLLSLAPKHPRAPEAMLAISNVQIELKDLKGARLTLEDLIKNHPTSDTAVTARERLVRLR